MVVNVYYKRDGASLRAARTTVCRTVARASGCCRPKAVIPRHTSKLNATAPCHSNCPLATAKKAGASKMSENGTTESVCLCYTVVCSALTALILPSVRGLKGLM